MDYYQKLFNYMLDEHGVTLLEQDMQEIINIVNEMQAIDKVNSDMKSRSPGYSRMMNESCKGWGEAYLQLRKFNYDIEKTISDITGVSPEEHNRIITEMRKDLPDD
jgi:hypothetical protein